MARTEAQKRANARWDAKHMTTVSVKMRRDLAEQLMQAAKANGTTRNAIFLAAAREYLATHPTDDTTT